MPSASLARSTICLRVFSARVVGGSGADVAAAEGAAVVTGVAVGFGVGTAVGVGVGAFVGFSNTHRMSMRDAVEVLMGLFLYVWHNAKLGAS